MRYFSLLFFVCSIAYADPPVKAVIDGLKAVSDIGGKHKPAPPKTAKVETENAAEPDAPVLFNERLFQFSQGPVDFFPVTPGSLEAGDRLAFQIHYDTQKIFWIPIPMLFTSLSLNYWSFRGDANYMDKVGSVQFTGRFPLEVQFIMHDFGIRFRPMQGFRLQPFLDLGLSFGGAHFRFDSSARASLNLQGEGYSLEEWSMAWGYYSVLGVECDIVKPIGISASFRYAHTRTAPVDVLDSHFTLNQQSYLLGAYFRF